MKNPSRIKRCWLWCPRWLRITLLTIASVVTLCLLLVGAGWWYLHPSVDRTDGVVYGQRLEKPLALDVIRPSNANGYGVAVMVSGSWKSGSPGELPVLLVSPLLRRGYTIFAIYHISQPEASVQEIIADVNRGIRYVRHNADEYNIDPAKIGVTGASAGGHLSLMLATQGGPGSDDAEDPIDRESSAVQAVAIFFPVTDLLNLGQSNQNLGDGGPPKNYRDSFGPNATDLTVWKDVGRQCSPIYHITEDLPPTLIHHGDADTLTPLEQSEWFCDRAAEHGHDVKLIVHPGKQHGWPTMIWDFRSLADWFDLHLRGESN